MEVHDLSRKSLLSPFHSSTRGGSLRKEDLSNSEDAPLQALHSKKKDYDLVIESRFQRRLPAYLPNAADINQTYTKIVKVLSDFDENLTKVMKSKEQMFITAFKNAMRDIEKEMRDMKR